MGSGNTLLLIYKLLFTGSCPRNLHTELKFRINFTKTAVLKKTLILLLLSAAMISIAQAQPAGYWQQQVNYKIDVTLNDVDNSLDGHVKMEYFNNSPDTLTYIWFHLWPNAYKNDKTAFTDQTLENGSTAFYFSDNDKRGYINRLDFSTNGKTLQTADHPQHQDIIKVMLASPLLPHSSCRIETPFHVKLPDNFSRGGHVGQAYMATQWYPKPAVYDHKGWHPMPYLDQGEFYSEFGNYEVQITLPKNYVVAATGNLQEKTEKEWMEHFKPPVVEKKKKTTIKEAKESIVAVPSAKETKTLHYKQDNVHDFAWFADKTFTIKHDTLQLPSGRIIDVYSYYYAANEEDWRNATKLIKRAILTKSNWVGEYPYSIVSVVDNAAAEGGGMEYPTITLLTSGGSEKALDFVINHEVGHNWFYGILASNERQHPWMDEGMNTYYDNRYSTEQYGSAGAEIVQSKSAFIKKRLPDDLEHMVLQTLIGIKKDQPIETSSEKYSSANYNMVAYVKTGDWLKMMEDSLGKELFEKCMKTYYDRWKFKHPYPEDFKKVMEDVSGRNMDAAFAKLNEKGDVVKTRIKKDIRFTSFFSLKETDKHQYISVLPALGGNYYDKLMLGVAIHNYQLPFPKLQFLAIPLYATGSKGFSGLGRIGYNWYPGNKGQHVELAVAAASFNGSVFTDSALQKHYLRFSKVVPSLKISFANKDPRSTINKFLQFKTFLISETYLNFERDTVNQIDIITYPKRSRYLNQLRFVMENNRALYPWQGELKAEQGKDFVRLAFEGNYFFNYAKGGGMDLRVFAGKFFYIGDKTFLKQFETDAYQLNMTGPKGYEDYTYSNYFMGRSEFQKFPSQQIMIRDGGFKIRTDLLSSKVGKTDDWLAAANFTTTIPDKINPLSVLPFKLPLKLFVDIGTYAEAWKKNAETGRFIYDAGVQLTLVKNIVNVYIPLLYSKIYKDYIRSTIPDKKLLKNISFSFDIQRFNIRKMLSGTGF